MVIMRLFSIMDQDFCSHKCNNLYEKFTADFQQHSQCYPVGKLKGISFCLLAK